MATGSSEAPVCVSTGHVAASLVGGIATKVIVASLPPGIVNQKSVRRLVVLSIPMIPTRQVGARCC